MNAKLIKPYKGKMIRLNYNVSGNGFEHSQTGVITASTANQILFNPNKSEIEIPIKYKDIKSIEEVKKVKK